MSAAIGDYTNADKIRGALGLTPMDADDQYILGRDIDEEILISLYDWIPNHATFYTTWTAGGATEEEKHYARLLRKYSSFIGAFHLCSGLELLIVQAIGDSKATAERFSNVDLIKLRAKIEGIAEGTRSDIIKSLSLSTETASASIFKSVPPASDPVVGS